MSGFQFSQQQIKNPVCVIPVVGTPRFKTDKLPVKIMSTQTKPIIKLKPERRRLLQQFTFKTPATRKFTINFKPRGTSTGLPPPILELPIEEHPETIYFRNENNLLLAGNRNDYQTESKFHSLRKTSSQTEISRPTSGSSGFTINLKKCSSPKSCKSSTKRIIQMRRNSVLTEFALTLVSSSSPKNSKSRKM